METVCISPNKLPSALKIVKVVVEKAGFATSAKLAKYENDELDYPFISCVIKKRRSTVKRGSGLLYEVQDVYDEIKFDVRVSLTSPT